jgi:cobalt-zinc-cadmium efflux system outer membrane protein
MWWSMSSFLVRSARSLFTLVPLLLAVPVGALAQATESPSPYVTEEQPPLVLADVLAEALRQHPEILAAEARYQAALQRVPQEASLPDPMVSTGYRSTGSPLPGAGLGSDPNANLNVAVSQPIPYAGKRQLRAEVAGREADAERQGIEAARLSLTARVKQAYYRLSGAYASDDVVRRNQELLTTLLQVSESRYAVGQAAQQDVIRAQTQVSLLALQRERLARERRTREGELNALLNRAPELPFGRPAELSPLTLAPTLTQLVQLADERSPMLLRDASMIARAETAVEASQREFKPDFVVAGGYGFAGSMPDMWDFRLDVAIPLQRARRRAAVEEQRRTLSAATATRESTRRSLQGELQEDYQMAVTAGRLAALYRDTVLPQARLALESSFASYQTGAVDFLSVLTNFGAVLEYEMNYIEQLSDQHVAASRLEALAAVTLLP